MLKHAHCKARQLTVTFILGNQLNCSLIRYCRNVYRIDSNEHDNECKKENCYLEMKNESLMA